MALFNMHVPFHPVGAEVTRLDFMESLRRRLQCHHDFQGIFGRAGRSRRRPWRFGRGGAGSKTLRAGFPPDGWAAVCWFSSSSVGGGQPEQVADLGPDDAAALQTDASALIF